MFESRYKNMGLAMASGAPGAKSAPRRSKPITFAKGNVQLFNLENIAMNPIGILLFDPSFNIRYTYDSKLRFEKLSELKVGVLRAACDADFEI